MSNQKRSSDFLEKESGWWIGGDLMKKGMVAGLLFLIAGCASKTNVPGGVTYGKFAKEHRKETNPVILIPGILGTRLVTDEDGRIVWGSFSGKALSQRTGEGRRALAVPMSKGKPLSSLADQARADGTLDKVGFGAGIGVEVYAGLLQVLAIGGYRDEKGAPMVISEHIDCFQFGYDWRKSSAENAVELDAFIEAKRKLVAASYFRRHGKHKEVKFDIVAHSMGGLVARYYLMYGKQQLPKSGALPAVTWAGKKHVSRLIQIGTPNGGATESLLQMHEGMSLNPVLPKYQPAVVGTFPAVYELLPRLEDTPVVDSQGKILDIYDPTVWERYNWGMLNPKQDKYLIQVLPGVESRAQRREIALDHITKCLRNAKAFHAALDDKKKNKLPAGLEMHTFHSEKMPTIDRLRADDKGKLRVVLKTPGDGTVTQHSALANKKGHQGGIIPWTASYDVNAAHAKIPVQPTFVKNLLSLLLKVDFPNIE